MALALSVKQMTLNTESLYIMKTLLDVLTSHITFPSTYVNGMRIASLGGNQLQLQKLSTQIDRSRNKTDLAFKSPQIMKILSLQK